MTASPRLVACRGTRILAVIPTRSQWRWRYNAAISPQGPATGAPPVTTHGQDARATWRRCPAKRGVRLCVLCALCGSPVTQP